MTTNKDYSQDFKDKALLLMREDGKSVADVAQQLKIPESTVSSWTEEVHNTGTIEISLGHSLGGSAINDFDELD
ncbi:MAG: hypothetical protein COC15_02665 [Legionellales bacterium]|nr:MAG: hypothetical protein COC15_02665 [Legionellales bacterium]